MQIHVCEHTDELRAFVREHPALDHQPALIDAIVTALAANRVIVVGDDRAPALVGCVVHDLGNPDGASEIVPLGCLRGAELPDALAALLTRGEQLVSAAGGRRVELHVPLRLCGIEPVLEALGYHTAWENVDLELDPITSHRQVSRSLPEGAAWQDVDEHNVALAHACYERSFRTVPGAQTPPLEEYAKVIPTFRPRQRILVLDGRALAFTRVGWKDEEQRIGEVLNLGRDPEARQGGLGSLALVEAMDGLLAMGASSAQLTVASTNPRAVRLYTGFGFAEKRRRAVLQKDLEPR
jgi:ribosomal protein S18 acetylase RimI-like enzyme